VGMVFTNNVSRKYIDKIITISEIIKS